MDEILEAFATESAELLEAMESSTLAMERGEPGAMEALFRAAHTLKGSAGIVGHERLQRYAHELENRLNRIRSGAVGLGPHTAGALLACRDRCDVILRLERDGDAALSADDRESLERLDEALGGSAAGPGEPSLASPGGAPASPSPTGTAASATSGSSAVPPAGQRDGEKTVRIADAKLDRLVNLASELVTVQAQLSQAAQDSGERRFIGIAESVRRLVAELRSTSMEMRLVRVETLFSRYVRLVRDISRELGKEVDLVIAGAQTELDKNAVESLADPLTHLLRNALDHGLEPPAEREAAGKPRRGTLRLSARHDGGSVVISVADDGRGIDWEGVAAKAAERGLAEPGAILSRAALENLIFSAGFSTSKEVSSVSGRGFGLDVVRTAIERLGGDVELTSTLGSGTEFALRVPLTIAIVDGFLVEAGGTSFVIPLSNVLECFERDRRCASERLVERGGSLVPLVDLASAFGLPGEREGESREAVVVAQAGSGRIALRVDRVVGGYQTVIKPLGEIARHARGVSGATVLADGSVALILDAAAIAKGFKEG